MSQDFDFDEGGPSETEEIAATVFSDIEKDGFEAPAVDALLSLTRDGQFEVLGDTLAHLAKKNHPDWAAELCRYRRGTSPCMG